MALSKNIQNLGFEIGKLFFGNKANGTSAGKTENSSEFSDCLSKLVSRDNKSTVQKEKSDASDVVGKKLVDDKNVDTSDDKTEINSFDKKVDNTDKADVQKESAEVDEAVDSEENDTADELTVSVNNAALFTVVDTQTENVDLSSGNAVEDMLGETVVQTVAKVGGDAYSAEENQGVSGITVSVIDASDVLSENEIADVADMNVQAENEINFSAEDEHYIQNTNVTEFSATLEGVKVLDDTKTDNVFVNKDANSDNVLLDDNLSRDVVSIDINDNTAVRVDIGSEISAKMQNVQTDVSNQITEAVAAAEISPEVKLSGVKNTKTVEIDAKAENAELSNTQLDVGEEQVYTEDVSEQTESELEDLDLGNSDNSFETEITAGKAEVKPNTAVLGRVDYRAEVDLSNTMTRNVNAAEAVQNTILHNSTDMVGNMGSKTMELVLNPENLGKIVIKMQSTSEGLNIKIIADNIDVNKGLEMRIFQIENTLKEQGVSLNNIEIEHSSVSDNTTSGFMDMNNFERGFNNSFSQNPTSERRSREEYIEYTEYAYDEMENADLASAEDEIRITGNYNVEFLA